MGLNDREYIRKRPVSHRSVPSTRHAFLDRIVWRIRLSSIGDLPVATISVVAISILVSGFWYLLGKNFFLPPPDNVNEAEAMWNASVQFLQIRDWLAANCVMQPHFWTIGYPHTAAAHVALHGGIMNSMIAVVGLLVFGLRVEENGWGSARTGFIMLLAVAGGVAMFVLCGQQTPAYGCWSIAAAMAGAVIVQHPQSEIGGWGARLSAAAYLGLVLAGVPQLLSGDPVQFALVGGGTAVGLIAGTIGRWSQWDA